MDHLITARRPDLVIFTKKKNLPNNGRCRSGGPQGNTLEDKYLDVARKLKKK